MRCSASSSYLLLFFLTASGLLAETSYKIASIDFEGPLPGKEARIRQHLGIEIGDIFDPDITQAASNRLREQWRDSYHPLAQVGWKGVPDDSSHTLSLVFTSTPGPRGKLSSIRFVGNEQLTSATLLSGLSVIPHASWWAAFTGNDLILVEEFAPDQEALQALYRQRGYLDAVIGTPKLIPLEKGTDFDLVWPIEKEGDISLIRTIVLWVDGTPTSFPPRFQSALVPGQPLIPERLHRTVNDLRQFYLHRGYAFVEVDFKTEWETESNNVTVSFSVQTGGIPRLERISLQGNKFTRDEILLREIPLQVGSSFNAKAVALAQQNLEATGLFSAIDLQYQGAPGDETYQLTAEVTEKATGKFEAGLSYDSGVGAALLGRVSERNFAFGEPWRGDALQLSLSAILGTEFIEIETGFRNPRIRQSLWSYSATAFYRDNQAISDFYNQKGNGASLIFSHPRGPNTLLSYGASLQYLQVYDLTPELSEDLLEAENELEMAAPLVSWILDTTVSDFRPASGLRLQQSIQWGLPLSDSYTQALLYEGRGSVFFNPWRDHIVQLRGGLESVDPLDNGPLPLPIRSWLGGNENLRGFQYQSVSPFEEGFAVGGRSAWWAGIEYTYPAHPRLDLSLYYEWGGVSADTWTFDTEQFVSNWGIGFQIRADNFPLRLDVAFPLEVLPEDSQNKVGESVISFSAGYLF